MEHASLNGKESHGAFRSLQVSGTETQHWALFNSWFKGNVGWGPCIDVIHDLPFWCNPCHQCTITWKHSFKAMDLDYRLITKHNSVLFHLSTDVDEVTEHLWQSRWQHLRGTHYCFCTTSDSTTNICTFLLFCIHCCVYCCIFSLLYELQAFYCTVM